jgi:phage FluMu protein gp41
MAGAQDARGTEAGGVGDNGPVSRQAAADVAQVMRGKQWLRRVVEVADAVRGPLSVDGPGAGPNRASHAS